MAIQTAGRLNGVVFDSGDEAGQVLARGGALNSDADEVLILGTGLAQQGDSTERLGVNSSDQVGIPSTVYLPKLANLDFSHAHGVSDCKFTRGKCQHLVRDLCGTGQIGRGPGQVAASGSYCCPAFRPGGKTFSVPATS
jgi:hypothetical protein